MANPKRKLSYPQIAEKYEVIHVAAYCAFSDMIKRVMKRNYDALMLGKDKIGAEMVKQTKTACGSKILKVIIESGELKTDKLIKIKMIKGFI